MKQFEVRRIEEDDFIPTDRGRGRKILRTKTKIATDSSPASRLSIRLTSALAGVWIPWPEDYGKQCESCKVTQFGCGSRCGKVPLGDGALRLGRTRFDRWSVNEDARRHPPPFGEKGRFYGETDRSKRSIVLCGMVDNLSK